MNYYQLQTISCYQFGDSSVKVDEYFKYLNKFNYRGGAINDLNCVYSYPYIETYSSKFDIKGIYSLNIKVRNNDDVFMVCLFILNEKGYLNLISLLNKSKEFYTLEDLKENSEGLAIVLKSEDDKMKEKKFLQENVPFFYSLNKIFKDMYFGIEIYSKEEAENINNLRKFADKYSYNCIVFNKVCYLNSKNSYKSYKILNCIHNKLTIDDESELDKSGPFFLLTTNVLSKLYLEKEILNQEDLVSKIDFTFTKIRGHLIKISKNADEELHDLAYDGLNKKINNPSQTYIQRLESELNIIKTMGFSDYFLLVNDYVNHFRNLNMKIGPGRGSACGCLVAYCLNITLIDPIKYNLYFERFLNTSRKGLPDIDIDFPDDQRQEVIFYIAKKYSKNNVSNIITFSSLKLKGALKRIGMVFSNINSNTIQTLSNSISIKMADTFEQEIASNSKLSKLISDPYFLEIINKAKLILDYPLNTSIHASGIIVSNDSLFNLVPLKQDEINCSLYEYQFLEKQGFLKLDILGLTNLSFIREIESYILNSKKQLINPYDNLNDTKAYRILNCLLCNDIFQLESPGIKQAIKQVKPKSIQDIAAILALYRPGPMQNISTYAQRKNSNIKFTSNIPVLDEILKDTYGILIYQEQIIEIAKKIALFDGTKADMFRKVVSKKDVTKMHELKNDFINGCLKTVKDVNIANKIYDLIEKFADYGFNKSHAVAYSYITYQLLFYKANYTQEFYLASLNNLTLGSLKFIKIYNELKFFRLSINGPSINLSSENVTYINNAYYVGFNSIKGISKDFIQKLLSEREKGKFASISDFLYRVDLSLLSKNELINFVNSGVLDCFNYSNQSLIDQINNIQMAYKFNTNYDESMLPVIDKKGKFQIDDFINQINSLGVCLSYNLYEYVKNPKYKRLYVIYDTPLSYHGKTKLVVASNLEIKTFYVINCPVLEKKDIVSIDDSSSNILINKEVLNV